MARICIVSPGQLGSNPRLVKEATTLAVVGHDVRTVTTKVMALVEPRDRDVMASSNWTIDRVPFDYMARWRAARVRQTAARKLFAATGATSLASWAASAMSPRLAAAAGRVHADLYIGHYPAGLCAAAFAARKHGSMFAFDAEDFHLGDLPSGPATNLDNRIIRAVEARLLSEAAYVTAASPGIADAYAVEYGIARPQVVLNVFSKSGAPTVATARGACDARPSVYWFSQTIGPDRGLECAVRAIALARTRPHLFLRGSLVSGFDDNLMRLAQESGADGQLHFLPPALPSQMEQLASVYDVGLVCETGHTLNRRIALTNKQFTYLLAGLPAVMSDIPAHRSFAAECEGATFLYAVDDSVSLATAMDAVLKNPVRLAEARAAALKLGRDRFNWDREQHLAIACVAAALGTARTSCPHARHSVSTMLSGKSA